MEYWLEPPEYENPECPICGSECETIVTTRNGEVLGCDQCLRFEDAYDYMEERQEELKWQSRSSC